MRTLIVSAALALGLVACVTPPAPPAYGALSGTPAGYGKSMAEDAIKQLAVLYPPASTRFNLLQATPDEFGATLVVGLRAKGFALQEFDQPAAKGEERRVEIEPASTPASAAPAVVAAQPGLDLRYVVDQQQDLNLYRITVLIGEKSLTRAYLSQNSSVLPAGAWVRKE